MNKDRLDLQVSSGAENRGPGVHSDVDLAPLDGPASIVLAWLGYLGSCI